MIVTDSDDTSKKVTGADSVTIALSDTLDASAMSSLHVSVWRSKPNADLNIKLVDHGQTASGGGDDSQQHSDLQRCER